MTEIKRALKYKSGSQDLVAVLRSLWVSDFEPTSAQVRTLSIGSTLPVTEWHDVERELASAADKIRVQVVNSEMRDAIDYEANNEQGLSIIAVGGDKLSRGLTLEGLTISYFLRASKMYDSLMQMGRWFGYRPGYVDLCRLYLTPDLQLWFRHVAKATEELRDRLDHMAMVGSTPESYGLRIQSHDILLVTAQNKMRHAPEYQVTFEGEGKIQTIFFNDPVANGNNATVVTAFLDRIGLAYGQDSQLEGREALRGYAGRRLWRDVPGAEIASVLAGLEFPEESRDVNGARLSEFIRAQLPAGELTRWTVAVLSGSGESLSVDGWKFVTVERKAVSISPRYVIKTVLSPPDEALDLDKDDYEAALKITNQKRADKGKSEARIPDGPAIRQIRGRDPSRGLLLLYPLSPANAGLIDFTVPIFGVVVSFPDSGGGRSVRYRVNQVGQLELL
jgi:hypothetical protein